MKENQVFHVTINSGGQMAIFDQNGNVKMSSTQIGEINFNAVVDIDQFVTILRRIRSEIDSLKQALPIPENMLDEAMYLLIHASKEAQEKTPDKGAIAMAIEKTKNLFATLGNAASLVALLEKASEAASRIF